MSTCGSVFSYYADNRQDFQLSNFINPVESYAGPSSYTTSFTSSDITDYPSVGNYGNFLNMKDPQITSSFSSFGPSETSENFGSTSYINYPPQTTTIFHDESPKQPQNQATFFPQQNQEITNFADAFKNQQETSFNSAFLGNQGNSFFGNQANYADLGNQANGFPPNFSSFISSALDNYAGNLPPSTSEVISEHVEVTKPVVVPVYKKFP